MPFDRKLQFVFQLERLLERHCKSFRGLALGATAACALAGCVSSGTSEKTVETSRNLSLASAKRIIQQQARWFYSDGAVDHLQIAVHFHAAHYGITQFSPASTKKRSFNGCEYEKYEPKIREIENPNFGPNKGRKHYQVCPITTNDCKSPCIATPTEENANQTAAAFLRWKNSTAEERSAFFAQETRGTGVGSSLSARASSVTATPEEVRRHRVIADAAIREKRFVDAAAAYEDALEIEPDWAQGHFNAALVLAEIYYYQDAINHMRKYLALMPGARDAREVQDKIYEWEDAVRVKQ